MQKHTRPHFLNNPFVAYPTVPNLLNPKLLGICAMFPFDGQNSAPRKQMFATHLGQAPVVKGAMEALLQTGMERKFGTATYSIRADENIRVLKVLKLYPSTGGFGGINHNPERYVLYEETTSSKGRIGLMTIPEFTANHPYFGFKYKPFDAANRLYRDGLIGKDEIIYNSPNVDEDGTMRTGIELMVAFISHPATADDGFLICEDVLPRYEFEMLVRRTVATGGKTFPLNLYGDENHYKICPDIGEPIREDGMLMAVREYNELLAGIEQSVHATMQIDNISDIPTYAEPGLGHVVDIRVLHDRTIANSGLPEGMDAQLQKYDVARLKFYEELLDAVNEIKAVKRQDFEATDALHEMLLAATAATTVDPKNRVNFSYQQNPLDSWQIEFLIKYDKRPGMGSKFTGRSGDKGVNVRTAKRKDMPRNSAGESADIVFFGAGTTNRQNPGRMQEHHVNSYRRFLRNWICSEFGIKPFAKCTARMIRAVHTKTPEVYDAVWHKLMRFYEVVTPIMLQAFRKDPNIESDYIHLAYIIEFNLFLHIPTDNERECLDMVEMLEREFDRINSPVTYTGYSGEEVTTVDDVVIAEMNIMMLEKIGTDGSAVSSARTQLHGIISQLTRADKYRYAVRLQSTRWIGETELRLLTALAGPYAGVEAMDRNNNPLSHIYAVNHVVRAKTPTNIEVLVDRDAVPFTSSRPLKNLEHIASIGGWGFAYKPYVNVHPKPTTVRM